MKWLTLTIIIGFYSTVSAKGGKCEKKLGYLAAANSNFTRCALVSSVPVEFCSDCKIHFDSLVDAYNVLITSNDTTSNRSCKEEYFDHDRLNIVEGIYQDSYNLWEKAFCSACYDSNGDSAKYTSQIRALITIFNTCINQNQHVECEECLGEYQKINVLYEEIGEKLQNRICFDIQDAMNRTRSKWSKDLGCCRRKPNLHAFAAVSSLFGFLPFIFYGGFIIYTKRTERNRPVMDAENIVTPQVSNNEIANNENVLPITPQPSGSGVQVSDDPRPTQKNVTTKGKDQNVVTNYSDDSDEEPALQDVKKVLDDAEFILNNTDDKNELTKKNKLKQKHHYGSDSDEEPVPNMIYQRIAELKSRQFE